MCFHSIGSSTGITRLWAKADLGVGRVRDGAARAVRCGARRQQQIRLVEGMVTADGQEGKTGPMQYICVCVCVYIIYIYIARLTEMKMKPKVLGHQVGGGLISLGCQCYSSHKVARSSESPVPLACMTVKLIRPSDWPSSSKYDFLLAKVLALHV